MPVSRNASRWAAYVLAAIAAVLIGVIYYAGHYDQAIQYVATNALSPIFALAAAMLALLALVKSKPNWKDRYWIIWFCYTCGMALWGLGELTWSIYALLLNVPVPYPSIGDIFWLAGYPFFFWALFVQVWPFREAFSQRSQILGPVSMLILAGAMISVLFPSILATEADLISVVIGVAYPVFDILLLAVAIPAFLLFRRGEFWKPLVFVILGITLALVGDLWFAFATLDGTYYNGHPLEMLFFWSYLAFALGFYTKLKQGAWPR